MQCKYIDVSSSCSLTCRMCYRLERKAHGAGNAARTEVRMKPTRTSVLDQLTHSSGDHGFHHPSSDQRPLETEQALVETRARVVTRAVSNAEHECLPAVGLSCGFDKPERHCDSHDPSTPGNRR